ncbi:hypothetical protein DOT_2315 [Desulfosporosinus sp. OT]|nr:hypothetical protein DOT_2315 [Desulfosporosinus sp. OT]
MDIKRKKQLLEEYKTITPQNWKRYESGVWYRTNKQGGFGNEQGYCNDCRSV